MCIISINEKRDLTKKEFDNCWDNNSHGAGFAWKNRFQKGFMDKAKAYTFYKENIAGNYPHVVHFRIQTSGGTRPELTHPFPIVSMSPIKLKGTTGANGVLFHNGIVSGWNKLLFNYAVSEGNYPKGFLSDTRVVAMCVSRGSKWILSCLDGVDRFVIFKNSTYEKWGTWEESNGIFFSNSGYKRDNYSRVGTLWDESYYNQSNAKTYCLNTKCRYYNLKKAHNCEIYFSNHTIETCEDFKGIDNKAKKIKNNNDCLFSSCVHYNKNYAGNCSSQEICIDYDLYTKKQYCRNHKCKYYDTGYENYCKAFLNPLECKDFER